MAVLGLCFCARAFSSCGKRGPLFITVRGPLTVAASLLAELRLQTRRLSNCGSRAQLLRGMWDLPRPGLEPVSPALAGSFSTTAPPGKPYNIYFKSSYRASLVAQWLRIRLPMQGTWVWALVREDPICHGAAKPVRHNYWACALEPVGHNYWAHAPRASALQQEKPLQWEACTRNEE